MQALLLFSRASISVAFPSTLRVQLKRVRYMTSQWNFYGNCYKQKLERCKTDSNCCALYWTCLLLISSSDEVITKNRISLHCCVYVFVLLFWLLQSSIRFCFLFVFHSERYFYLQQGWKRLSAVASPGCVCLWMAVEPQGTSEPNTSTSFNWTLKRLKCGLFVSERLSRFL